MLVPKKCGKIDTTHFPSIFTHHPSKKEVPLQQISNSGGHNNLISTNMIEVVCEKNGRAAMWLSQEQLVTIRKALYEAGCAALVRGDIVNHEVYNDAYDEVKYALIDAWPEEDWN